MTRPSDRNQNQSGELAPEGIGPFMLAACGPNEFSFDIPFLEHGAFSNAILEALGTRFNKADRDTDSRATFF